MTFLTKFAKQLVHRWPHCFRGRKLQAAVQSGQLLFRTKHDQTSSTVYGRMTSGYIVYIKFNGGEQYLGPLYDDVPIIYHLPSTFQCDSDAFRYSQQSETKGILTCGTVDAEHDGCASGISVIIYDAGTHCCTVVVHIGGRVVYMKNRKHVRDLEEAIRYSMSLHNTANLGRNVDCDTEPIFHDVGDLRQTGLSYKHKKKIFERISFKCLHPISFYIMHGDSRSCVSERMLIEQYRHIKYTDDRGIVGSFILNWVSDPDMKAYAYAREYPPPMVCPPGTFNLWSGFKIENDRTVDASQGSLDMFTNHIELLTNHNLTHARFVTKWLAQIVQNPATITGVALVFVSGNGVGRNMFIEKFREIINFDRYFNGSYGISDANRRGKLIVRVARARNKDAETWRDMITNRMIGGRRDERNINRVIMTSKDASFSARGDHIAVIRCSDERKGDSNYFSELSRYFECVHNQRAIFEYLQQMDLRGVDWNLDRPILGDAPVREDSQFIHDLLNSY